MSKTWKEKCKMPPKSSKLAPVKHLQFWSTACIAKEKSSCKFKDNPILAPIIASDNDKDKGHKEDNYNGFSIDIVPQVTSIFSPNYKRYGVSCVHAVQ